MGRDRKKRNRSFDGEEDKRRNRSNNSNNVDVEVLIAHDPMLGLDSDDEIDLGGSLVSASSFGSSNRNSTSTSQSKSNSNNKEKKQKEKKKKKKETEKNEDGVDNDEVFYVEKIKDKRWNLGRWEYLLQWQGYGPEFDTWEPTENMDCDDLLQEFEAEWAKKAKTGFDRGQIAREIVGLCDIKGKSMFVVLYKGSDDAEYIPRDECSKRCPNLVIEFYENRQVAKPPDDLDLNFGEPTKQVEPLATTVAS